MKFLKTDVVGLADWFSEIWDRRSWALHSQVFMMPLAIIRSVIPKLYGGHKSGQHVYGWGWSQTWRRNLIWASTPIHDHERQHLITGTHIKNNDKSKVRLLLGELSFTRLSFVLHGIRELRAILLTHFWAYDLFYLLKRTNGWGRLVYCRRKYRKEIFPQSCSSMTSW